MRILAVTAIMLALVQPISAQQTASVEQGKGRVAFTSHFINAGADADSYSILAEIGVSGRSGVGVQAIRISDDIGTITLGSLYLKREIYEKTEGKDAYISAYGGFRFLNGDSNITDDLETDGLLLGLSGQTSLCRNLNAYGSAGVSFLEDTLTELEFSLGYRLEKNWELDAGYKTYLINGESLGGVTVGISALF